MQSNWGSQLKFDELERKHKLPAGLLNAVMTAESAGNEKAVSPVGAQGLFQFMPDTAKSYGIDPFDPAQAADGAARMYGDLSRQYGGDLPKMLAGYNWGSGNLAKHGMDNAPEETRNYISKITQALGSPQAQPVPQMAGGAGNQTLMGGAGGDDLSGISFDDLPDINPAAPQIQTKAPSAQISFDDLPDAAPKNPNATPAPPVAGENWWEVPEPEPIPQLPERGAMGKAAIALQGVNRGAADIVGGIFGDIPAAGMNLATAGINKLTGTDIPKLEKPWLGSERMAEATETIGEAIAGNPITYDPETMSGDEKLLYNSGRMGSQAAMGGAGLAKAAASSSRGAMPSIKDAFLEPYRQNPSRALFVDTAAGVGSGAGLTAAEELAPDSPMAQMFGSILGGVGGATTGGLAVAGKEGVKNMARGMTEGFSIDKTVAKDPETHLPMRRKDLNDAASIIQGKAVDIPAAEQSLKEGMEFYGENNLPMPGTGAMSNDPGLIGVENTARVNDPVPFIQRDRAVREAQGEKVRSIGPDIPDEQRRSAQALAKTTAEEQLTKVEGAAADTRAKLLETQRQADLAKNAEAEIAAPIRAERGNEGAASQALDKELVEGTLEPKTKAKNLAFDAIDPQGTIQRDASPVVDLAREIQADIGKLTPESSGVPGEFMQKLEKIAKKPEYTGGELPVQGDLGGKASMADLMDARKYINTAAEKAQQAGNFELAKNLRRLKGEINKEADKLISEGGAGSKEAAAAKKMYEEEYAPYFAEGFGRSFRDKIQKDPTGRTVLPPSKTADFFLNNSSEAAADLSRITKIAKNPEAANKAVSNYFKAQLATLVKNDTIEPATMRAWLDKRKDLLGQFPEAKAELENTYKQVLNGRGKKDALGLEVRNLAAQLKTAERDITVTERRINDSVLKTLIDNEPQNAAAKILSDGDPEARMSETLKLLGSNKEAKDAFKRSVADYLENRLTGTRTEQTADESYAVLQSKVEAFLKKPGVDKAITQLYADQPDAMNALRVAQRIGRDMAKTNIRATSGSDTMEKSGQAMKLLEGGLKAKFGALKGGSYMRTVRLAIETVPGLNNEAAVKRILVRAQLEPELALHLYGRDIEKMPSRLWTAKLNRLLGYGAAAREATDEDKEPTN